MSATTETPATVSTTAPDVAEVQARLEAAGVRYAMAGFTDVHGRLKGKVVPIGHLPQMARGSELFTGAAVDGVPQEINDEEVAAHPDLARSFVLPWKKDVAYFPSTLYTEGKPFEAGARHILQRQLDAAAELGLTFNLGIETEFFVLKDGPAGPAEVSERDTAEKPCYDLTTTLDNFGWLTELVEAMDELGWDVYSFDHEDARGQFEIDFTYSDALTMADRVTFFRMMAGEIARKHGYFASFMPKPFADRTGSGAHFNMSLADLVTGENLFATGEDPHGVGVSELGYHFIAGILRHAKAISAVIAPTVNSYKRLVRQGSTSGSTWAPVFVSYGDNNRTNMIRVPSAGGRVECRAADISCNPYLGAAMILAAGLEGVREHLDPGAPHRENMYEYSDAQVAELGIDMLPRNLGEAVEEFQADSLSREVFGEALYNSFIDLKRGEWDAYTAHVSSWETERYLKFF
ncbi:type III glutamate--ammonia ligase [Nocardioides campestrisoli]|uniref:type III glutamate--ammonia ligase n=1 Tax=Nocardioides campestrisoli TaxID=2736757 RepID=UPI00163DE3F7|nr:type III glutamate--ammonia ligase [Nocardioides campestrisoli]